jgi:hypothetical protein
MSRCTGGTALGPRGQRIRIRFWPVPTQQRVQVNAHRVIVWVPTGCFSSGFDASFAFVGANEAKREAAHDGHVLGAVATAVARQIVLEPASSLGSSGLIGVFGEQIDLDDRLDVREARLAWMPGVARIGTQRVPRFKSLALIVCAARGLAVDGNEIVPVGPELLDPTFEKPSEQNRVDAIDQAQASARRGCRNETPRTVAENRDAARPMPRCPRTRRWWRKSEAGGPRPGGIHHPPGLTVIVDLREMLEEDSQASPRHLLVENRIHGRTPRIKAPRNHDWRVKTKSPHFGLT